MAAVFLLAAFALQASEPAGRKADSFDLAMQGKSIAAMKIAEAMEKGFRVCAQQVAERKILAAGSPELAKAGVALRSRPPAEIGTVASTVFKSEPIYAEVEGDGSVWVIGSATVPACKVTAGDSKDVQLARGELDQLFGKSKTWSHDPAQSFVRDGVRRQTYILNKDKPGAHMIAFIDGPVELANDGNGVQAIITVGIQKPEAK